MFPLQTLAAITSAVSVFPLGVLCLGESQHRILMPVWTRCFHSLEVGMAEWMRIGDVSFVERGREMVGSLLYITTIGGHCSRARWMARRWPTSYVSCVEFVERMLMLSQGSSASDICHGN